ncbi:MAG TPA: UvrD-helicase domain-containing protein, partial [Acidimicrobiales bacterium]|nr:UvrD-helicase domain-containing protein [Acidimicrobiales bacterium]
MSVDAPLERVDPRPEDVAARERIRHDLGSTIFVQAAAGSGKTSALVARVTCLVDHGLAELREIAAISFTEAAAAELRGRVASSLCEPPPLESPPEAAARRVAARLQIDESAITTIHGFAQRILSEHPLEADLPLRFEVADERTASIAREERFEAFVDRLYDDPGSADLMRAATVLGIGVEPLRALASQMSERFDGLDLPPEPTLTIPDLVAALAERVRAAALECLPHAGLCTNEEDLLLRRIVRLADALGAVDVDGGWLDLLGWITGLAAEKRARVGRRGSWRGSGIEPVRDAIVAYEGARVAALASIHDAVLRGIGRRMLVEAQSFAEARRHAGDLFFH